jgi:uncharacterized membrane protein YfcA
LSQVLLAAGGAWQLAWTLAVVFVAYALRGATGFGAGVVAIPLLLLVLPLPVVIPLVTAMGMLASFGQALHQRRSVQWAALRKLFVPSLVGVAAGLWLFAALDPRYLLRALAVFIIGHALWGYLPWRSARAAPAWLAPLAGALGGFVATVFGGMAGPFYVVYLRTLALDKLRFRATVSVALLCLSVLRATGYGGLGLYDARVLWLFAAVLPVVAVAMIAGDRWHHRLDEARFGHVVAALLAASGVALLLK